MISDRGMRVNCDTSDVLRSKVKIVSQTEKFSISEIEVHTLGKFFKIQKCHHFQTLKSFIRLLQLQASGLPGEKPKLFRGCFTNIGENNRALSGPLFASCQQDCSARGYLFFGIKVALFYLKKNISDTVFICYDKWNNLDLPISLCLNACLNFWYLCLDILFHCATHEFEFLVLYNCPFHF